MKNIGNITKAKGLKFLGAISAVILAVAMLFATAVPAYAAPVPTAATNAGTGADVATVGTIAWAAPGNITTVGSPYATAAITAGATTNYLQGTNYGFAIPAGSTINGIQVDINRSSAAGTTTDTEVKLVRAGVIEATNKSTGASWTTPGFGVATFGGPADLWGAAWTPADINNANFGVVLSATDSAGATASVDYMQITVTYTTVGTAHSAVVLGLAGNFAVLAQTAVTNATSSTVVGNVGISPATLTGVTGFAPVLDASGTFATSALVTGKIYAAAMTAPTPDNMTTATNNRLTAYTTANGVAPDATELGSGNIGGLTFSPGCYYWSTGVNITTDIYLTGSASDVWIFQCGAALTVSSGVVIHLSGGAVASNVFWTVAGLPGATIGTGATFNGTILSAYAIVLDGGDTLNGRTLAASAVNLNGGASSIASAPPAPATTTNTVTLTSGTEPSVYGNSVTFTATITGGSSPTGLVQFKIGGNNVGSPVSLNGSFQATYTTATLAVGSYSVTAVYAGDIANNGSTSLAYTHVVTVRPITVTANPLTKNFLAPDPALTYSVTSGSLVPGDAFSGSLVRTGAGSLLAELPGTYPILVGTLTAGSNYNLTYVGALLTIAAASPPPPPAPSTTTTTTPPTTTTTTPPTTTTTTPPTTTTTTPPTTTTTTPPTTTTTTPPTTTTTAHPTTTTTTPPTTTTTTPPTTTTTTPAEGGTDWFLLIWGIIIGLLFLGIIAALFISRRSERE